jgi:predicted dehydrogenase
VEDITATSIEYASGAIGTYSEVHFAPQYGMHMTLYGDRAQLDVEANHDTGECWIEVLHRHTHQRRREQPTEDTGHGGADPALIVEFARAVREGRQPLADVRAGLESAAIGIAVRQSIDTGRVVDLPRYDEA